MANPAILKSIEAGEIRTIADLIRHFQERTLKTINVKSEIRAAELAAARKARLDAANKRASVKGWDMAVEKERVQGSGNKR